MADKCSDWPMIDCQACFEDGHAAGRAEVLALVRTLPSPITTGWGTGDESDWYHCSWCAYRWRINEGHYEKCLWKLAQETGKEQA